MRKETNYKRVLDHDFGRFSHEVVDHGILAALPGSAIKVYVVLVRHSHYITRVAFPGRLTIAREAGISKNKITESLNLLKKTGLITIKKSGSRFAFKNIYCLVSHPPKPGYPLNCSPKSTVNKDKRTGRFCKSLKTGDSTCPTGPDNSICPTFKDEKYIEREKIELKAEQFLENIPDQKLRETLKSLGRTLGYDG